MKKNFPAILVLMATCAIMGCDGLLEKNDDETEDVTRTRYSKLVVVNHTDTVLLSVQMRVSGTSDWGGDLLDTYTDTGTIAAGGSCTIPNIAFGTYDLHAYCYGNFDRYGVVFDNEEGFEWGFR